MTTVRAKAVRSGYRESEGSVATCTVASGDASPDGSGASAGGGSEGVGGNEVL